MMLIKGVEWLCDSGKITRALFNVDAINEKVLSMMPRLLGPCVYDIRTHVVMTTRIRVPSTKKEEVRQ
jgi:hypothetical protein